MPYIPNNQLMSLKQHGPGPMLGLAPHAAPKGRAQACVGLSGRCWLEGVAR